MAKLTIELVHDEPDFFRETRVGYWHHVYDYETGHGEWYWVKEKYAKRPFTTVTDGDSEVHAGPQGAPVEEQALRGLRERAS